MTETFTADNIYKTVVTIKARVGENLAACPYGDKFMLYHVPSGKTVQHLVKPFDSLESCCDFGHDLLKNFPFLDCYIVTVRGNKPEINPEQYKEFIAKYNI